MRMKRPFSFFSFFFADQFWNLEPHFPVLSWSLQSHFLVLFWSLPSPNTHTLRSTSQVPPPLSAPVLKLPPPTLRSIPMPLFIYIYSLCVSVWYHHTCRKNLPSFCGYNVRTLSKSVKGNSPSTLPMVRIFVV